MTDRRANRILAYEDLIDFKRWVLKNNPELKRIGDGDPFYFDYVTGVDGSSDSQNDIPGLVADGSLTWGKAQDIIFRYFNVNKNKNIREEDDMFEDMIDIACDENKNRLLDESESAFGRIKDITTYYCREFIWKDAPKNLKVIEVPYIGKWSSKSVGFDINDEDKKAISQADDDKPDTYRFFIYYVTPFVDHKWSEFDDIEDDWDYEEVTDPESDRNKRYPEEYNPDFKKAFPTFEDWLQYKSKNAAEELKYELASTDRLPYSSVADDVKISKDGTPYVIIGWRA